MTGVAVALRKLVGMSTPEEPELETDLKPLTESVGQMRDKLLAATPADGTNLSRLVVDAQTELAEVSQYEVTKRLADLVVHVALRRGPGMTPRRLLSELLETYPISDESWHEKVGPELRRVLAARGHVYGIPDLTPPASVLCERCGRETTGDYVWDWPDRRMVVCSACAFNGQPVEPPNVQLDGSEGLT